MMSGTRKKSCVCFSAVLCGVALYTPQALAEITLAANDEVLQAWRIIAKNGSASPSLADGGDGATVIEWHGAASVESYRNDVVGDSTLTPLRDGSFYKATVQGDLRETTAAGVTSYLQFAATHSNDRAVLSQNAQLDMFLSGVVGQDYSVAVGDVTTSFSTLGTNTLLRGFYGYKQIGDAVVTASIGRIAESWSTYAGTLPGSRYLSDAYAVKVDFPAGEYGRFFVSTQGYDEDQDSLESSQQTYTASVASTDTAGFSYQRDTFNIRGEYGSSRWREKGTSNHADYATVIDGEWRTDSGGVRAGYHDIGLYYASLSADVTAGIRENYVAGDWAPLTWLGLAADLRTTRNDAAYYSSDVRDTDALSVSGNVNLTEILAGLQLVLQYSHSAGKTVDTSKQDTDSNGATVTYTSAYWGLQLGNSYQRTDNVANPGAGSKTTSWNGSFNTTLNRDPKSSGIWGADITLSATSQRQELDDGSNTDSRNYDMTFNAQRMGWGTLALTLGQGWITQADGGPELKQQCVQLDASYPWGEKSVIKAYLRDNSNDGDPASHYSEHTMGVLLSMVW